MSSLQHACCLCGVVFKRPDSRVSGQYVLENRGETVDECLSANSILDSGRRAGDVCEACLEMLLKADRCWSEFNGSLEKLNGLLASDRGSGIFPDEDSRCSICKRVFGPYTDSRVSSRVLLPFYGKSAAEFIADYSSTGVCISSDLCNSCYEVVVNSDWSWNSVTSSLEKLKMRQLTFNQVHAGCFETLSDGSKYCIIEPERGTPSLLKYDMSDSLEPTASSLNSGCESQEDNKASSINSVQFHGGEQLGRNGASDGNSNLCQTPSTSTLGNAKPVVSPPKTSTHARKKRTEPADEDVDLGSLIGPKSETHLPDPLETVGSTCERGSAIGEKPRRQASLKARTKMKEVSSDESSAEEARKAVKFTETPSGAPVKKMGIRGRRKKTHSTPGSKPLSISDWTCPECGKEFPTRWFYRIHMADKHDLAAERCRELYQCPECQRTFRDKAPMAGHRATNHGVTPEEKYIYRCQHCDKVYYFKHKLKEHLKSHVGINPLKCPVCPFLTEKRRDLKNHALEVHKAPLAEIQARFGDEGETDDNCVELIL